MSQHFNHDHATLEEFVRALASTAYWRSEDSGDVIDVYWQQEAEEWVKELDAEPEPRIQTEGPKCKQCGAFTTYTRVNTHGLCMKCEREQSR